MTHEQRPATAPAHRLAAVAVPDEHGRLDWPDLEASVRQGIRVILSTRPGEQLMRPEYGAGLDRLLHAPNTLATRRQIRDWVMDSLGRWERRILLDRVEVLEVPDGQARRSAGGDRLSAGPLRHAWCTGRDRSTGGRLK